MEAPREGGGTGTSVATSTQGGPQAPRPATDHNPLVGTTRRSPRALRPRSQQRAPVSAVLEGLRVGYSSERTWTTCSSSSSYICTSSTSPIYQRPSPNFTLSMSPISTSTGCTFSQSSDAPCLAAARPVAARPVAAPGAGAGTDASGAGEGECAGAGASGASAGAGAAGAGADGGRTRRRFLTPSAGATAGASVGAATGGARLRRAIGEGAAMAGASAAGAATGDASSSDPIGIGSNGLAPPVLSAGDKPRLLPGKDHKAPET